MWINMRGWNQIGLHLAAAAEPCSALRSNLLAHTTHLLLGFGVEEAPPDNGLLW
jgi:hypothetical protein